MNVSIIGAGIAGLSAAIHLKKNNININIKIFERATQISNQGLGFLIMSNGFEMFKKMGLEREIREKANPIYDIKLIRKNGKVFNHKQLKNCFAISRPDCIDILTSQIGSHDIFYGKKIIRFHENENQEIHKIEFRDGHIEPTDVIIATDGLNSSFRTLLFPHHTKHIIPEKEIVCMLKLPSLAKKLGSTFLKLVCPEEGFNMGLIPSGNDELIWFVQINEQKHILPKNNAEALRKFCLNLVQDLPVDFKTVIQLSDFTKAYLWEMYDMDLLPSFHKNGIVLIGDSAHPLLSFTSQGASAALEDSYYLSKLLSKKGSFSKLNAVYKAFYEMRKASIQKFIADGRLLLDQFLRPEKYKETHLPFASHGAK